MKNKFIILGIIIIFIFNFYSSVFGATYESIDFKYGKVKPSCLNIRCGPGLNYNKVGKLYKGEYIDVFAKIGNWYIVQTDSNLVGAVSAEYIEAVYDENERYSNITQKEVQGEEKSTSQSEVTSAENITSTDESENVIVTDNTNEVSSEYANNTQLTEEEQEFLNLINSNRKNNGLEELQIDSDLQNVARLKAEDLKKNNYFSHVSETYGDVNNMLNTFKISYKSSAENIAGNKNLSGAVEAWMNSENHKINILNEKYNYTGVAIIESDMYGKIYVEIFIEK